MNKGIIGRRNSFSLLKSSFSKDDKIIHVHCSSYGEYLMSENLIKKLKNKFEDHKILLSFISPSGFENINKNKFECVIYLPTDTSNNCKKFYEIISPNITLFMKNEVWPNFIKYAKKSGSKTYSIGGNFKANKLKRFLGIYHSMKKFDRIFVLNKSSKKILNRIDKKKITVIGDLRFDSDIPSLSIGFKKIIDRFINGKQCIVFGSTWKEDEKLAVKFITESKRNIKYIIAPHEISNNCHRLKQSLEKKAVLFSELMSAKNFNKYSCLIVDNVGMLSSLYSFATVAYVGGGLGKKGLHNTIEPAHFSKPIIIGNNFENFDEAEEMIKNGGMLSISNYDDFYNKIEKIIANKKIIEKMSRLNNEYYLSKKGAVETVLDIINQDF